MAVNISHSSSISFLFSQENQFMGPEMFATERKLAFWCGMKHSFVFLPWQLCGCCLEPSSLTWDLQLLQNLLCQQLQVFLTRLHIYSTFFFCQNFSLSLKIHFFQFLKIVVCYHLKNLISLELLHSKTGWGFFLEDLAQEDIWNWTRNEIEQAKTEQNEKKNTSKWRTNWQTWHRFNMHQDIYCLKLIRFFLNRTNIDKKWTLFEFEFCQKRPELHQKKAKEVEHHKNSNMPKMHQKCINKNLSYKLEFCQNEAALEN